MMQHLIRSFVIFSLALSCIHGASDPHPDKLRVMTYNTWYVFAKRKEISTGKQWINSQTPDIVALQELTNIKPEFLAELAKGWQHPHSQLLKTSGFSVGLTSRWPIEVVEKRVKGMHHGYLHAKTNGFTILLSTSPRSNGKSANRKQNKSSVKSTRYSKTVKT